MPLIETIDVNLDMRTVYLLDQLVDAENSFNLSCRWDRAGFIGWLVADYSRSVNEAMRNA